MLQRRLGTESKGSTSLSAGGPPRQGGPRRCRRWVSDQALASALSVGGSPQRGVNIGTRLKQ